MEDKNMSQNSGVEENIFANHKSELIYELEDKPPVQEAFFAAFQHLLAIFVAIITPPLIIAGALQLDLETTSFLISMALLASGVSTFVQCFSTFIPTVSLSFRFPWFTLGLSLCSGCTFCLQPLF